MFALVLLVLFHKATSSSVDDLPVLEHLGCDQCLRLYAPVCGTDQKTYTNACRLNCINSIRQKSQWVYIQRYGPCIEVSVILNAHNF